MAASASVNLGANLGANLEVELEVLLKVILEVDPGPVISISSNPDLVLSVNRRLAKSGVRV